MEETRIKLTSRNCGSGCMKNVPRNGFNKHTNAHTYACTRHKLHKGRVLGQQKQKIGNDWDENTGHVRIYAMTGRCDR